MRALLRRAVRSWPVAFGFGLLLMVIWVTTRGGADDARPQSIDQPIREVRATALRTARAVSDRLFMDDFVRELAPAVVADHRAGRTPSMGWPEQMDGGPAARDSVLLALAQSDLTRLTDRDIALGLHVVEHDGWRASSTGSRSLMGTHEGTPYCVVVYGVSNLDARIAEHGQRAVPINRFLSAARRRNAEPEAARDVTNPLRWDLLAGCTAVHRFGVPGEQVRRWVDEGSAGTLSSFLIRSSRGATVEERRRDELHVGTILNGGYFRGGGGGVVRACRAGDLVECRRLFVPDHTAATTPENRSGVAELGVGNRFLLGHLEREFGPEAFEAFWSSQEPVDIAFREAFGIRPAEWVHGHATRVDGVLRSGPTPGLATVATALLLILGGLAIGTRAALRRVVG